MKKFVSLLCILVTVVFHTHCFVTDSSVIASTHQNLTEEQIRTINQYIRDAQNLGYSNDSILKEFEKALTSSDAKNGSLTLYIKDKKRIILGVVGVATAAGVMWYVVYHLNNNEQKSANNGQSNQNQGNRDKSNVTKRGRSISPVRNKKHSQDKRSRSFDSSSRRGSDQSAAVTAFVSPAQQNLAEVPSSHELPEVGEPALFVPVEVDPRSPIPEEYALTNSQLLDIFDIPEDEMPGFVDTTTSATQAPLEPDEIVPVVTHTQTSSRPNNKSNRQTRSGSRRRSSVTRVPKRRENTERPPVVLTSRGRKSKRPVRLINEC